MLRPSRKFRKSKKIPKAELVPVLDAMFIMIFFILSTGEFLKVSEIGSDLPVMRLSMDDNPEKKKLILKVVLNPNKISLINEVNNTELFSSPMETDFYNALNEKVLAVKNQFPEENRVMIYPDLTIKYDILIKVLDAVREIDQGETKIKLFNQIIFR